MSIRGSQHALAHRLERLRRYTLPHAAPRPVELLRMDILWRGHQLARELRASDLTLVTPRRARTLYRLARTVQQRKVEGAIVDCGIRNGGSSMLLSEGALTREIWAFDSFQGLPEPTSMDVGGPLAAAGSMRGSPEMVWLGFQTYGSCDRFHLVKGWFEETLEAVVDDVGPIAILHVDADYYEPVRLALEVFYPSVRHGGYVIVDDYFSFPGARRATDELRARYGVSNPIIWDHYWRR